MGRSHTPRSATLGSSTMLAPQLDRLLPGVLPPQPAQAPTLTGSMASAHPLAPQTPPPQRQPQLQQPQQPPPLLLPQLQPRRHPPAAPRAPSPPLTATPASATPSGSMSAAPTPAPAPQPQQQQQPQQLQQQLRQPAQCPLDLQLDSLVSSRSHMVEPHSQAVLSGCMVESTRASCGAAPRLTRRAPISMVRATMASAAPPAQQSHFLISSETSLATQAALQQSGDPAPSSLVPPPLLAEWWPGGRSRNVLEDVKCITLTVNNVILVKRTEIAKKKYR